MRATRYATSSTNVEMQADVDRANRPGSGYPPWSPAKTVTVSVMVLMLAVIFVILKVTHSTGIMVNLLVIAQGLVVVIAGCMALFILRHHSPAARRFRSELPELLQAGTIVESRHAFYCNFRNRKFGWDRL